MNDALIRLTHAEHASGDLASAWQRIIDEFDTYRQLLVAQVEAWAQLERSPALRERLAAFQRDEITDGVAQAVATSPGVDEPTARAIAAVTGALADGLVVHWLIDPASMPSGHDIAVGLRALADLIDDGTT